MEHPNGVEGVKASRHGELGITDQAITRVPNARFACFFFGFCVNWAVYAPNGPCK